MPARTDSVRSREEGSSLAAAATLTTPSTPAIIIVVQASTGGSQQLRVRYMQFKSLPVHKHMNVATKCVARTSHRFMSATISSLSSCVHAKAQVCVHSHARLMRRSCSTVAAGCNSMPSTARSSDIHSISTATSHGHSYDTMASVSDDVTPLSEVTAFALARVSTMLSNGEVRCREIG